MSEMIDMSKAVVLVKLSLRSERRLSEYRKESLLSERPHASSSLANWDLEKSKDVRDVHSASASFLKLL